MNSKGRGLIIQHKYNQTNLRHQFYFSMRALIEELLFHKFQPEVGFEYQSSQERILSWERHNRRHWKIDIIHNSFNLNGETLDTVHGSC